MASLSALLAAVILVVAAGFHFYWSFGGKLGVSVSVPQLPSGEPVIELPALGSFMVGAFLLLPTFLALVLGFNINTLIPGDWLRWGGYFFGFLFATRAFSFHPYVGWLKRVRSTRFSGFDTYMYSPLCFLVALVFLHLSWT